MDLVSLLRKVKRQFGDEYGIIINDQDVLDWCNEAQLDIVRNSSSNDVTVPLTVDQFPVKIADRVALKRVLINNKALTLTSLAELEDNNLSTSVTGTPAYFYYEDGTVGLWPGPNVGDVYQTLVTYARIPEELHLLAPYLQFLASPVGTQFATIAASDAFKNSQINLVFSIDIININVPFDIAIMGTGVAAGTMSFRLSYQGGQTFRLAVSDNTTIVNHDLVVASPVFTNGSHFKGRITYVSGSGTATLFEVNETTGVETSVASVVGTPGQTANTTTAFPIGFGSLNGAAAPTLGSFNLYEFQYGRDPVVANNIPIVYFDGSVDLVNLPIIPASPLTITSKHSLSVGGNPSPQIFTQQELELPELYHEDIVKYCIAKANDKNQNYKGSEANMKAYQENTTNRRNEADATDAPQFKIIDPNDFEGDWWYS